MIHVFAVCGSTSGGEGGALRVGIESISFCSCLCVHVFLFVCLYVCMNMGGPLCVEVEGIYGAGPPHSMRVTKHSCLGCKALPSHSPCLMIRKAATANPVALLLLTMVCYSYWCSIAVICLEKLPPKNVP